VGGEERRGDALGGKKEDRNNPIVAKNTGRKVGRKKRRFEFRKVIIGGL